MAYQNVASSRAQLLNYQYVELATPVTATTAWTSTGISITIVETGAYKIQSSSEATIPGGLANSSFETGLFINNVLVTNSERLAGVNLLGILGTIGASFAMNNMTVRQLSTNDVVDLRIRTIAGSNPTINARNIMTLKVG